MARAVAATRAAHPAGIYATAVGKKYAMAISGIVLMAFVLAHMVGNLKLYFGASSLDRYSHWLRTVGEPALPEQWLLYGVRAVLLVALVVHVHAAYVLTKVNRRARPDTYRSKRDYVAADFASRTMRWTGVIVLLFVVFHLLDLTWGPANPDFVEGDPYHNTVASFQRAPVAIVYVIANLALGVHLYHGAWSMFQSMGWVTAWRRTFATAFAAVIVVGNVSFPLAVLFGVVS
jgi:succinate dehydrogenase / fumarate reductase, cytochrome b subunit